METSSKFALAVKTAVSLGAFSRADVNTMIEQLLAGQAAISHDAGDGGPTSGRSLANLLGEFALALEEVNS